MSKRTRKIAVIGAGDFGYPMANYLAEQGHNVFLYDTNKKIIDSLKRNKNTPRFPNLKMNNKVTPVFELEKAVGDTKIFVTAVPSQRLRTAARDMKEYINKDNIILNLSKGLELETNKRLSEVLEEELDGIEYKCKPAVLSGGMIAAEFAKGNPLYATIASDDIRVAKRVKNFLRSGRLILDTSKDMVGIELAGPLKNVIAIAVGIGYGLGYEASTIGGFIQAISKETIDLAVKLGARRETFEDCYAWGGDLYATCSGDSRNRAFGIEIGKGETVEEALEIMKQQNKTIEGYPTTKVLYDISQELKMDVPLITEAYNVLYKSKHAKKAIFDLMDLADRNKN